MAELLLELHSEEIPAGMQKSAALELLRQVKSRLELAGVAVSDTAQSFYSSRRIGVAIDGLPVALSARSEEVRGPAETAPAAALEGFKRKHGEGAVIEKRNGYYFATIETSALPLPEFLIEALPQAISALTWPKSMRWPQGGDLRWVRPLRSILCVLDGKIVSFEIGGCASGDITYGHPVNAPGKIKIADFAGYQEKLEKAYILIDVQTRTESIHTQIKSLARACDGEWRENPARLAELAGLAEYPQMVAGEIDKQFMSLPAEVLDVVLWKHQQCLLLRNEGGAPLPFFLTCADGEIAGEAVKRGTERVIRARLADAQFFIREDLKTGLDAMREATDAILLHPKLGSMKDKSEKLKNLDLSHVVQTGWTAEPMPNISHVFGKAAHYAKADLASQMVQEFPELQGFMGGYYYQQENEGKENSEAIANAIAQHYRPQGLEDILPETSAGILLAIVDKMNTLAGFYSAGEIPTASKDPYALRRAALGIIRVCEAEKSSKEGGMLLYTRFMPLLELCKTYVRFFEILHERVESVAHKLCEFIIQRLVFYLRSQGKAYDLVDSLRDFAARASMEITLDHLDTLDLILRDIDGESLLVAYRRATGILDDEEKKDRCQYNYDKGENLKLSTKEEENLRQAIEQILWEPTEEKETQAAILSRGETITYQMTSMASLLRPPVDAFFENVRVNVEDEEVRRNRLKLLAGVRKAMDQFADFSRIQRKPKL